MLDSRNGTKMIGKEWTYLRIQPNSITEPLPCCDYVLPMRVSSGIQISRLLFLALSDASPSQLYHRESSSALGMALQTARELSDQRSMYEWYLYSKVRLTVGSKSVPTVRAWAGYLNGLSRCLLHSALPELRLITPTPHFLCITPTRIHLQIWDTLWELPSGKSNCMNCSWCSYKLYTRCRVDRSQLL